MPKSVVRRRPHFGPDFDVHFMDEGDRVRAYTNTLIWYKPQGWVALVDEGHSFLTYLDPLEGKPEEDPERSQHIHEWFERCDDCLTQWSRKAERNEYVVFGPFPDSGDVGFYYDVQAALEAADLRIAAGDAVPKGFTGLLAEVSDHGNVTFSNYSRGRRTRTLFSVV